MTEFLTSPEIWGALVTLIFLEVILGIDNVIFISIAANRLPEKSRVIAWRTGLALALLMRIIMLMTIGWIMEFNRPIFSVSDFSFGFRDLILFGGGLFLIYRSTIEIGKTKHPDPKNNEAKTSKGASLSFVIAQIVVIDFVFSFDSILTAIGLSNFIGIMIAAVVVSMAIMMLFLSAISDYIKRNPSMEVLALGFLILIGFILLLEAFHYEIPKGYIYFAVGFSFTIEFINIWKAKSRNQRSDRYAAEQIAIPVELRGKAKGYDNMP